jgi:hypothetical protein
MIAILSWLPIFRENVVPPLAQFQQDLPISLSELSSGLLYSLTIAGIALVAITVTLFILSRRKAKI